MARERTTGGMEQFTENEGPSMASDRFYTKGTGTTASLLFPPILSNYCPRAISLSLVHGRDASRGQPSKIVSERWAFLSGAKVAWRRERPPGLRTYHSLTCSDARRCTSIITVRNIQCVWKSYLRRCG